MEVVNYKILNTGATVFTCKDKSGRIRIIELDTRKPNKDFAEFLESLGGKEVAKTENILQEK